MRKPRKLKNTKKLSPIKRTEKESPQEKTGVKVFLPKDSFKKTSQKSLVNFSGENIKQKTGEEKRRGFLPDNFSADIEENLQAIKKTIGESNDVEIKEFRVGKKHVRALLIAIDGLADQQGLNDFVLNSLMHKIYELELLEDKEIIDPKFIEEISSLGLTMIGVKKEDNFKKAVTAILSGDSLFLIDGCSSGLIMQTKGWKQRGVTEPATETLIRGPREGFTENIRANTALVRRRLRDPNLKIVGGQIGKRSKTDYALIYIEGIVNRDVLEEVKKRLEKIEIDQILDSGYLEQFIEDSYLSPFPQIQSTERPDKLAAAITEGRVAILVDGSPFALIVPAIFGQFFQSPEDYYNRWIWGSFSRFLRIFGSYFAAFTPALYIAITSFHPGLIPTKLALSMAAARQGVPFPAIVEALIMELSFALFREAGARLPRAIGQTVGIVGGLIIGQAAVTAKLASPIMIIVVALTAIAGFSIPSFPLSDAFRIIRFPLMLAASIFGLYGVVLGFIIINIHMVNLKSFGQVYLAPFVPYRYSDFKDLLIRVPIKVYDKRPEFLEQQDKERQPQGE